MYEGYHKQNRQHALQSLNKMVVLPEVRLGVGNGETLDPLGMKLEYQNKKQFVVVPDLDSVSHERAAIDGQGNTLNPKDFDTESFYIGESIGGF